MQNGKTDSGKGMDMPSSSSNRAAGDPDKIAIDESETRYRKKNFVDLTALIRSIQRAEGNKDCYRRVASGLSCNQMECAWRAHCFYSGTSD